MKRLALAALALLLLVGCGSFHFHLHMGEKHYSGEHAQSDHDQFIDSLSEDN